MALVRQCGRLQDGGPCEHTSPCDEEAIARVPNPVEIASAGLDLCSFHLALWADCRGDGETLRELGVDDLVATDRYLRLDQAPPRLDREVLYLRFGIGHRGLAHFCEACRGPDGDDRVITVDRRLELDQAYGPPAHVGLDGWVDHVGRKRGWVELDDETLEELEEIGQ